MHFIHFSFLKQSVFVKSGQGTVLCPSGLPQKVRTMKMAEAEADK